MAGTIGNILAGGIIYAEDVQAEVDRIRTKIRTTDATSNPTSTFVSDTSLQHAILTGVTYTYELRACYVAPAAGDFKAKVLLPGGSNSLRGQYVGYTSALAAITGDHTGEIAVGGSGATTVNFAMWGGFVAGANGFAIPQYANQVTTAGTCAWLEGAAFTVTRQT